MRKTLQIGPLLVCAVLASVLVRPAILRSNTEPPSAIREVIVKLRHPLTPAERALLEHNVDAEQIEQLGASSWHRLRSRTLDASLLQALLRFHSAVAFVEPNYRVHIDAVPNDPEFPSLWGLHNIGQVIGGAAGVTGADVTATPAWDAVSGSRANVVAVIDTGVDYTHPDLARNIWKAPSAFTVTIGGVRITCAAGTHGFNAVTNTCDPRDDNNHGTHAAGTIGAVGNNAAGVSGVNWIASIMPVKFLDADGSGTIADAVNAIEFAIQAKHAFAASAAANVRVLSNSWGGAPYSQALADEIARADAEDMLFVAAAGNSASNNDITPTYPASFSAPNVIAVAASDNTDQLASFSNYGTSVHLAAPGVNILSTTIANTYRYFSGTSMATPYVSGAAALLLSKCAVPTSTVKSTLLSQVDPIGALTGLVETGGRLNVDRAVRACTAVPDAPATLSASKGASAGQIALKWSAVAGATSYKLKRSMLSGGPYSTIQTRTGKTSYVNSGLTSGKTYYYVVAATNGSGESAYSNKASAIAR